MYIHAHIREHTSTYAYMQSLHTQMHTGHTHTCMHLYICTTDTNTYTWHTSGITQLNYVVSKTLAIYSRSKYKKILIDLSNYVRVHAYVHVRCHVRYIHYMDVSCISVCVCIHALLSLCYVHIFYVRNHPLFVTGFAKTRHKIVQELKSSFCLTKMPHSSTIRTQKWQSYS